MEKLFGMPINQLMVALIIVFLIGVMVMGVVAIRNRVIVKMAVRNIPRRRAQTALIVLGLMLATLLFSASFATGDTLTHSIRTRAVKNLGQVDVLVRAEPLGPQGQLVAFDTANVEKIRSSLSGDPEVEGIAPLLREYAPIVIPSTRLSEAVVSVLGFDEKAMTGFDRLVDGKGTVLSLGSLGVGEAYISTELAKKLDAKAGDTVQVFLGPRPTELKVAKMYEKGASPGGELSVVMPLSQMQAAAGNEGKINTVMISAKGDAIKGAEHSDDVLATLKPVLEGSGLKADPVKQEILKQADEAGSQFSTVFLLFGQFSIFAGILLIFLIFVMLAAERKRELGIARAVGTQRGHLITMFAFEGAVYALIAAAVGSVLGMVVGLGMVRIMAVAFGQFGQSDFQLVYTFNWRSMVIAYTMGMVLTFAVVLISSWRVSRLNIVRAIRDLPEPRMERRNVKGLILAIAVPVLGFLLAFSGARSAQLASWTLGVSLIVIGIPFLARRLGASDRITFTVAGAGLLLYWLTPVTWHEAVFPFLPEMKQGIEMFFLSGIMLVLGAVWIAVYNSDLLLKATVFVFGRVRGLPPVLKTSVAYPMQNRFRTGMTLAMFSLVVFTLMVMAFIIHSMAAVFQDIPRLSGGYEIRANTSYANPIRDIRAAMSSADGLNPNDFLAIGSINGTRIKAKQDGTEKDPVDFVVQGIDKGYADSVTYKFSMTANGYNTSQEVWQALQNEPGTAVVSPMLVPAKTNYNVGGPTQDLTLEGFYREDKTIPEVYVLAKDPRTGNEQKLRVIGVLDDAAFYAGNLVTSQGTLNALVSQTVPPQGYMFRLKSGVDAEATAKALKKRFLENGMQAEVIADEINKNVSTSLMVNNLLQGFMGLGLVVGIAALGVIAARSVVERRQQIGVLRALGFQKGMVEASFLLESSFIALLGLGMGIGLGFGLTPRIIEEMGKGIQGVTWVVPWANIVIVGVITYGASLLTTFFPAWQASKVYPAEALRYE